MVRFMSGFVQVYVRFWSGLCEICVRFWSGLCQVLVRFTSTLRQVLDKERQDLSGSRLSGYLTHNLHTKISLLVKDRL